MSSISVIRMKGSEESEVLVLSSIRKNGEGPLSSRRTFHARGDGEEKIAVATNVKLARVVAKKQNGKALRARE